MNKLTITVKKLSPNPGDFLIVTLKGYPTDFDILTMKETFASMPFLKGVYILFLNDMVKIRKEKPQKGKHKVYLNNLEYLEYLDKKKGGN